VAVVAVFEGVTQEQYKESVRRLTDGGAVTSPADWPVPDLLVHAAGMGENGFRVVDVWESEEAFRRFGEILLPILGEIGVAGKPDVFPTHTLVKA
jgi:hypothetical protein